MNAPIHPHRQRAMPRALEVLLLFCRIVVTRGEERLRHGQRLLLVTGGDTIEQSLAALVATPVGASLAQRRPDCLAILRDRDTFQACPEGSLGRHYTDFLAAHGMDESYYTRSVLVEVLENESNEAMRWYRARVEYCHDLRHVLSGYPPNDLGETCLLSFRFGQIGHRGALLLAVLGLLNRLGDWRAIYEAFERGRRARILDTLAWEDRFAEPLAAARAWLGLSPTKHYPAPYAPDAYTEAPHA